MSFDSLGLLLRWMHIFAAIALFGGAIFQGLVLLPALSELAPESRQALLQKVRRRWSKVVMMAILLLLISGLTNYLLTSRSFKELGPQYALPSAYHMLFGIKFLLAMFVFFLASVLAGRSEAMQRFRDQSSKWISVALVAAAIIVGISGVMRSMHTGPNIAAPSDPPTEASAE